MFSAADPQAVDRARFGCRQLFVHRAQLEETHPAGPHLCGDTQGGLRYHDGHMAYRCTMYIHVSYIDAHNMQLHEYVYIYIYILYTCTHMYICTTHVIAQ